MSAPALEIDPDGDARRRDLLAQSDRILGLVEELRLAGRPDVPPDLADAAVALRARLGRVNPGARPQTANAVSNLLFAVQQRLMAANPKRQAPRAVAGRAAGSPVVTPIRPGIEWKLLVLPPRGAATYEEWLELVDATVERALERWAFAQRHAVLAARAGRPLGAPLAVARVAWNNYWELFEEAAEVRNAYLRVPERARATA